MSERKVRTGLTVLCVMIGVTAIVALISLTSGISNSISAELSKIGPTTLFVMPAAPGTIFTGEDVAEISSFPNVSSIVPMLKFSASMMVSGQNESVTVYGIDNSSISNTIGGLSLYAGTTYNGTGGPAALVGYDVAFPNTGQTVPSITPDEPIYLKIFQRSGTKSATLVPIGILNAYGSSFFVSPDGSVFVPLQEAESLLNRYSYNLLVVKATNTSTVSSLDTLLSDVYNKKATVISVQQLTSTVSSVIGSISLLLAGIASISLLVAGISILSIMMVSVNERIHEIGILKSIGFRQSDIMLLFLSEAVIIGLIGGMLGSALGAGASYILPGILSSAGNIRAIPPARHGTGANMPVVSGLGGSPVSATPDGDKAVFGQGGNAHVTTSTSSGSSPGSSYKPSINLAVIGSAVLLAVIVSVISSLYPAWKASRIDPIRALRTE